MTSQKIKLGENSGYITIDEIKLRYVIEGKGIPCLVIGMPSSFYRPIFSSKIKEHIKFIFVGFKIFKPSVSINVSNLSMDTIIKDLEKIRNALGFEKIAVLGHSAFGIVALEYAFKYPEYVSHIIMICSFPPNTTEEYLKKGSGFWESDATKERKMIREKNNEPLTKDFLGRVSPTKALILQYVANAPVYWYNPTYDCSWIWEGIELNMDLFNYFYSNIIRGRNITNKILNNTIPIFLAMGRYDYSAPYILWEDLINEIPNLTYYLFEKSGHYPMLEEQMLFDRRLINWIKKP